MQREKKEKGKEKEKKEKKKSSRSGTHWLSDANFVALGNPLQSRVDSAQAICDDLVLSDQTVLAKMIILPMLEASRA